VEIGDPELWIPSPVLEGMLEAGLHGMNLEGLPLRTRSKVVKEAVCGALGYPVPLSFKKTQPRFPGQNFDTYTQKSMNLQIWNEELSPNRRYALIRISDDDRITKVRVVGGTDLAHLDTTGAITTKYQARLDPGSVPVVLVSQNDTPEMIPLLGSVFFDKSEGPTDAPRAGRLLPVAEICKRLAPLVGTTFTDPGMDQERNRGAALHRLVCERLGYSHYEDNGQFPDVLHQLLEVKIQTSPTINLGLVLPNSGEELGCPSVGGHSPRHLDTRYAVFYGETDGTQVRLTHLFVSTGSDFFDRFRRFEGKVINGKIQIPLPRDFFGD